MKPFKDSLAETFAIGSYIAPDKLYYLALMMDGNTAQQRIACFRPSRALWYGLAIFGLALKALIFND